MATATTMEQQGETTIKTIVFSGKKTDWETWSEKFMARSKRRGYKKLLIEEIEIPKKSEVLSEDNPDHAKKILLKEANEKA